MSLTGEDWSIVPDDYVYGTELLHDTSSIGSVAYNPGDLDIKVKVGCVKGLNRLYFFLGADALSKSHNFVCWGRTLLKTIFSNNI